MGGRSTGLVPAALLLASLTGILAFSKNFVNSSLPDSKFTFVVNFDFSQVICQHSENKSDLHVHEMSILCDGKQDCFSNPAMHDESFPYCEKKCTSTCNNRGACLYDGHQPQCYCNSGFSGPSCEFIDKNECLDRPCHLMADCLNTPIGFSCVCRPGFHGDGYQCADIDECSTPNLCPDHSNCVNLPGTHYCNCTEGFTQKGDTLVTKCLDINECELGNHNCGKNQLCENTIGGFTCVSGCTEGYELINGECFDIDECKNKGVCDTRAECFNSPGSYSCVCEDGMTGDGKHCEPVADCTQREDICDRHAQCIYPFKMCQCVAGFVGDGITCHDIDECEASEEPCKNQKGKRCVNIVGGHICCEKGSDDARCIEEQGVFCAGGCGLNAFCGNKTCECLPGYSGDPQKKCLDVNECDADNLCPGVGQWCVNVFGSYLCCGPHSTEPECQGVHIFRNSDGTTSVLHSNHSKEVVVSAEQGEHSVTQQGGFIAVGLGVIRANGTLPSISVLSRRACTSYCPINSECVAGYCECSKGFGGNPHLGCEDINECELNTPCGEQTDDNWCVNTEGSFTCCTRDSSQDECIGLEIISGPGGGLRLVGGQKDDKIYHASVNETLKLEEFSAKVHQYQNTSEGGAILIVKQTVPTDVTILKPEEGEMGLEITGDGIKKERTQTPRATVTLPGIISTIGGFSSTTTAIPVTEIPIHVPGVSQKSPEDKKNETSGTTVLILPSSLAPKPDVEGSGLESTEDGDMLQSEKSTTQTSSTLRGNINVRFTTLDELRGNVNGTRTTVKEDKEVTKGPKTVIDGDGHEQEATIDGKADKRSKTTIDRDESGDVSVIDRIVGTTANPTEEEPDPDKEGLEIVHKQTKPVTDVSTVKPSQSSTTEILSTTAKSTTDSVTGSVSSDKPDLVEDKGEKSGQEHDDKKPSGVKSAAIDQKESGSSGSSSSSSSGTVIITQGNGGEKEAASPNNKPKTPEPEDHQGQNTFEEEKTTTEPTTGETGLEIKWEGAAGRPTSEVASTEGISSEVTSATLLSSTVDDTKSGTDKVSTTASSISATPETTGESALKTTTDGMPDTDIHDGENPESTQGEDGNTGRKFTKSPETDEEKNTSEPTTVETGLEIVFKGTTTPLIPPGSTVGVSSTPIQSITETISFLSTSTPAANVSSESPDTVGTTREGHVNVSIGPSPTSTEETTPEAGLEIIHVSTTTAQSTTVEEEKITAVDNGETATTAETTAETSGKTSQGSSEGTTNSTPLSVSIPATPEEGLEIFGKPLHSTEKPAETTATLEKEENKASTIGTTVEKIETTTAPTDALSTEQPDLVLTVNTTGAPASTETTTHSSTAEASAATTTAETADITTDGAGQSSTIGDSKMSTETSSSATTTTLVTMKKAESETTTASTPAEAITTTEILEAAKKMTSSTSDGSITAEELTTTESVTATAESASSEKISPEIVPLVITPSLESTTTEQPDLVLLTASSKGTLKPSDSSTSAARKTTAESTTVSVTITEKATSPSSIDSTGTPSVIVVASTSETTIPPPLSSSTLVSSIATSSLSPPTKATSESMTSGSPSFESTASPIEVSTTQLTTVQKTSISTKISQATQIPTTIRLPSTSLSTPSLTSTSHPSSTLGTSASTAASTSSPTSSIEPTAPSTTVAGLSTVESARNPNEAIAITNIAQEEKTSTAAISNGPTGETTQITLETAPGEIATKAPGTDIETATSNPDDDLTAAPTKQQRLPPTDVPAESESSTSSSRPSEKGTTKDIYSLPEKPTPSPVTLGPNNATKCVSSDECGDDALCERRTGVCRCQPGFQGAPPSTPCSDVDECAEGLHKCHDSARCHNIVGTYACFCPMGYRKNESGACIDIDECAESRGNCCSVNGTCVNKEGSYGCECKPGFFGDGYKCMPMEKRICTEAELIKAGCGQHHVCMVDGLGVTDCNTCKMGFKMVNGNCTDVNECAEPELNMCSRSADCNNLLGTYACSCKQGFKGDGYMCEDIDECSGNPCHPQAECENLLGSFKCTCPAGFTGDGIKECQNPLEKSCENVKEFCGRIDHVACLSVRIFNGSLSSVCECEPGFRFNKQKNTCEDINECDENRHNCDPASSTCANEEGSFHCDCAEGYEGIGGVCVDVNECERGTAGCHSMAMCLNQPGSCGCKCMHGFTGDGIQCNPLQKREEDNACTAEWDRLCLLENKTCHVDEEDVPQCGSCIEGHHPINGSCQPVHGAGTCADPKKNTCDKNAECIDIPGTPGKHFCTCKKGFIGDGLRCDDIDECSLTGICHLHATCQNVPGSFNCICNTGYTGNGFTCTKEAGPNCHLNGELCHKDAECTMDGQCKCKDGFEGDGFKTCTEIGSTPTTTPAAIDSTTTGKQATFTQKTESTVKETTTTEPPILTEDTRSSTSTSTGPMVKGSITEIEGPESVEMIPGAARVNLTGVTTVAPTMTTPATAATKLSVGPEPPSTIPASLAKTTHQSGTTPAPVTSTVINNESDSNARTTVTSRVTDEKLTSAKITINAIDSKMKTTLTGFDSIDQRKTTPTTMEQLSESTNTPTTDASTTVSVDSTTSQPTTDTVQVTTKGNTSTEKSTSGSSTPSVTSTTTEIAGVDNNTAVTAISTATIPEAEETDTTTQQLIPESEETESTTSTESTTIIVPEAEEPESTTTGEIVQNIEPTEKNEASNSSEKVTTRAVSSSTVITHPSTIPEGAKDNVTMRLSGTTEIMTDTTTELPTAGVTVGGSSSMAIMTSRLSTGESISSSSPTSPSPLTNTEPIPTEGSTGQNSSTVPIHGNPSTETFEKSSEVTERPFTTTWGHEEPISTTSIRELTRTTTESIRNTPDTTVPGIPSKKSEMETTPSSAEISSTVGLAESTTMEIIWSEEMSTSQLEGHDRKPQETTTVAIDLPATGQEGSWESDVGETTIPSTSPLISTEIVSTSSANKGGEEETTHEKEHTTRTIVEATSETRIPTSPEKITEEITSRTLGTKEPQLSTTPITATSGPVTKNPTRIHTFSSSLTSGKPAENTEATPTVPADLENATETSSIAASDPTTIDSRSTTIKVTIFSTRENSITSSGIPDTMVSWSTTESSSSTLQVPIVKSTIAVTTTNEVVPTKESSSSTPNKSATSPGTSSVGITRAPTTAETSAFSGTTTSEVNTREPTDSATENPFIPTKGDPSKKLGSSTVESPQPRSSTTEKSHHKSELPSNAPAASNQRSTDSATERTATSSTNKNSASSTGIHSNRLVTKEPNVLNTGKQPNASSLVSSTMEATSRSTTEAVTITSEIGEPTDKTVISTTEKTSNSTPTESLTSFTSKVWTTDDPITKTTVVSPLTEPFISSKSPASKNLLNPDTERITTGASGELTGMSMSSTTEQTSTSSTSTSFKSSPVPPTTAEETSTIASSTLSPTTTTLPEPSSSSTTSTKLPGSSTTMSILSSSIESPTSTSTVEPSTIGTSNSTVNLTMEQMQTTSDAAPNRTSPQVSPLPDQSSTQKEERMESSAGETMPSIHPPTEDASNPTAKSSMPSSLLTVILSSTTASITDRSGLDSTVSTSVPLSSATTENLITSAIFGNEVTKSSKSTHATIVAEASLTETAELNHTERSTTFELTPSTSDLFKEVTDSVSSTVTTVSSTQSTDQSSSPEDSATMSVPSVHSTQLFTSNGNTAHTATGFTNLFDTSSAAPPSMTPPNFETTELAPTTEAEIYGSTTPEDNVASTSTDSTWTGENNTTRHPALSISKQTETPSTHIFMKTTRGDPGINSNTVPRGNETEFEDIGVTTFLTSVTTSEALPDDEGKERGKTTVDESLTSVTVTQPNVFEYEQRKTSTLRQSMFSSQSSSSDLTVLPISEDPMKMMSFTWASLDILTNTEQSPAVPILLVETTRLPNAFSAVGMNEQKSTVNPSKMSTRTEEKMTNEPGFSIGKGTTGSFLKTSKHEPEITEISNTNELTTSVDSTTDEPSLSSTTATTSRLVSTNAAIETSKPITASGNGTRAQASSTKETEPVTDSPHSTQSKLASTMGDGHQCTAATPGIRVYSTSNWSKEKPSTASMVSIVQQTTKPEMRSSLEKLATKILMNPEGTTGEPSVTMEIVAKHDKLSTFSGSSSTTSGIINPFTHPRMEKSSSTAAEPVRIERITTTAEDLVKPSTETSTKSDWSGAQESLSLPPKTSDSSIPTTVDPEKFIFSTSQTTRKEDLGLTLNVSTRMPITTTTENPINTRRTFSPNVIKSFDTGTKEPSDSTIGEPVGSGGTTIKFTIKSATPSEPEHHTDTVANVESSESTSSTVSSFEIELTTEGASITTSTALAMGATLEKVLNSNTWRSISPIPGNLTDLSEGTQRSSVTTDASDSITTVPVDTTAVKPWSVTKELAKTTSDWVTSSFGVEMTSTSSVDQETTTERTPSKQSSTTSTKTRETTVKIETTTSVVPIKLIPHDVEVLDNVIQNDISGRTTGQTQRTETHDGRGATSSEIPTTPRVKDNSMQGKWMMAKVPSTDPKEHLIRGSPSMRPESFESNKRTTAAFPIEDLIYTKTQKTSTLSTNPSFENPRFSSKYSTLTSTQHIPISASSHAPLSTIEKISFNGQYLPEATTDDGIEVRTELVGHSSEVPQREGQRGLCTAEDRSRCHEFAICDLSTNSCRCKDGFKGDGYTNCQYKITSNCITNTSLCHPDAFCDRHVQKCACNAGYIGDGILCSPDPQDCVLRKELCSTDATCSGRRCHCVEGFTGDGIKCVSLHQRSANCSECDVNAHCDQGVCTCNIGYFGNGLCCVPDPRDCVHFPGICHPEAACDSQNRQCACRKGYLGDGISCFPAVSCVTDSSVCHKNAICLPSGHCMCRNGFEGNGHSCQQITALGLRSEGHDVPSLCGNKCNRESELCIDNECICKHGFKKTNGVCEDVDECLKSPCHPLASCQNTRGSYSCACPEGYVGDGKACVQHLKIGDLGVFCENDGMTLVLSNETQMFEGKMYVRGQAENPHCIKTFSPLQQHSRPYTFKVFFEHCNVQLLENNTFAATVIVQKHPHFITTSADSYELKCAYSPDVTKVQSHVNVSELAPTSTLSNQFDGPTCSLKITDDQNDFVESAKVGQSMVLRLEVSPNGTYGILPRDCVAVNIETGERYHLTDRHGCAVDDQLFPEFAQLHPSATEAVFRTFKWPDSSMIRFQCDCMACVGPCPMPDCNRLQKKLLPRFRRAHQGENDEIELDNQLESENVVDTKRKAFSRLLAVHEDVEEQISQEDVQQWSRSALSESLPSEGVCVKAAVLVGSSLLLILSFGFLTSVVLHRRRSNPSKSPDSPISVISF